MALVVALAACKKPDPGPDLQIVGESMRVRSGDPVPHTSPWFDGHAVHITAARGEIVGLQVLHRGGGAVSLALAGAHVHGFDVLPVVTKRASTDMYGTGTRAAGTYPDELVAAAAPTTDPTYFQIAAGDAAGTFAGELAVGGQKLPVELVVSPVKLPPLAIGAWAEYNAKELAWANVDERACSAMFRERGVLLVPPMHVEDLPKYRDTLAGSPIVPVDLGNPATDVPAWITATANTGMVPFAIPIDEPKPADRAKVRALGQQIRDAGGGPGKFLFAVTDERRAEYGDLVDLYITLKPRLADAFPRWTYNGNPPGAGSFVVDAANPGTRTWGWIAWRYKIPIWYVWDALYWHDRHNNRTHEGRGRALDARTDALSFDNGDDRGNLDGVLALPNNGTCAPTLRLEALRRGLEDRALLELAASCDAAGAAKVAEQLVPRALGDASGDPTWPSDEGAWEDARRRLLAIAACK